MGFLLVCFIFYYCDVHLFQEHILSKAGMPVKTVAQDISVLQEVLHLNQLMLNVRWVRTFVILNLILWWRKLTYVNF